MSQQRKDANPTPLPDCGCYVSTTDLGIRFCSLHAAAPELLAALRDMLKLESDRQRGTLTRDEWERRKASARAAIEKATGEEGSHDAVCTTCGTVERFPLHALSNDGHEEGSR